MSVNSMDLAGDAGNSFSFDAPGATVTGAVVGMEEVQQTDMQTGEPAVWPDGQKKMMYRVDLDTELRDGPDDDGRRSVYLKGSRKRDSGSSLAAVLEAVRSATGSTALAAGGTLTLTYVADGEQTRRGYNPPKLYTAAYVAPGLELGRGQNVPDATPAAAAPAADPAPDAAGQKLTPEMIAAMRAMGIQVPGSD